MWGGEGGGQEEGEEMYLTHLPTHPHTHTPTHLVQCWLCGEEYCSSGAEAPLHNPDDCKPTGVLMARAQCGEGEVYMYNTMEFMIPLFNFN